LGNRFSPLRAAINARRKMRALHAEWESRRKIRASSKILITPFSPFQLSDHYLSDEIDTLGLYWLNSRSKKLSRNNSLPRSRSVIYCQVDQLEEFAAIYLPNIKNSFVLLTGKWGLPSLAESPTNFKILENPFLIRWFSQNQVFPDLGVAPFPYGVEIRSSVAVLREMKRRQRAPKSSRMLVPFVSVHKHLGGEARMSREMISPHMRPKKPHSEYLSEIRNHRYVLSLAGDRPDTYRHWECLSLGAFPVSNLEAELHSLFGDNMIFRGRADLLSPENFSNSKSEPSREIATVKYWKNKILQEFKRQKKSSPKRLR